MERACRGGAKLARRIALGQAGSGRGARLETPARSSGGGGDDAFESGRARSHLRPGDGGREGSDGGGRGGGDGGGLESPRSSVTLTREGGLVHGRSSRPQAPRRAEEVAAALVAAAEARAEARAETRARDAEAAAEAKVTKAMEEVSTGQSDQGHGRGEHRAKSQRPWKR